MKKITKFWQIIILDALGLVLMLLALATGWLPGPGGIPLFIVGLSLLAINHEWAERYIDLLKKYADKLGDLVFVDMPLVQATYDVLGPLFIATGLYFAWLHAALWHISAAVFCVCFGLLLLLGNRKRWTRLKTKLKRK